MKKRIFEPEVARLYRRRIDKHIRRTGNHASVAMWYMHFNYAGHRWYIPPSKIVPPSKIDGSYKPDSAAFLQKERECLEAQRIAQSVDSRPVYHHACGNFGDIFTLNCYIGPTSPLQERSEWPSRWAEKRPFPLMACEHGLMLVPYWFRPRQFPLSVVYSDEPIFDEITAQYFGPEAYSLISPELFDLYDIDRKPRGTRLRALIKHHAGYQRVKSLFARESLRAWRTYGMSGIVFNAINWDFEDPDGEPSQVMQALRRYFGDTDLYIAGPPGDWPSKDHSFIAGERVRKQIVLLNDLGRDTPCELGWRVLGADGAEFASGRVEAVAKAGTPSFYPLEFDAPAVMDRTEFALAVDVVSQPEEHFKPESFAFEVFPTAGPLRTHGRVLLFDPVGRTSAMLDQGGVAFETLNAGSDMSAAALIVVGRESYNEDFVKLADDLGLEDALSAGANLLVFEQTRGAPLGLELQERSARRVFIAAQGHSVLAGLRPEDFINFRGESDFMEPYPDAPPETETKWPARFFKWGNRGIVSTYAYRRPHYAPFKPLLVSGFDLTDSPLLEARWGRGRVVLCQLDVTSRFGTDPVSRRLIANLLGDLTRRSEAAPVSCVATDDAAAASAARFGIGARDEGIENAGLIIVGKDALSRERVEKILSSAGKGARVVILPGAASAPDFGVEREPQRVMVGRTTRHALTESIVESDLFLKQWVDVESVAAANGWVSIVEPGLIATREVGRGQLVTCSLDPDALQGTRAGVKAQRLWDALLTALGVDGTGRDSLLHPERALYERNEWETRPRYINW